jgi:HSP20 family protein
MQESDKEENRMTALSRWDPSREMMTMRQFMDRFFSDPYGSGWQGGSAGSTGGQGFALDVAEENDDYVIKASVPGVRPEDIDITIADNVLTIKGESKADEEIKEENYHLRERRFGSFSRSISLPATIDAEKVEANCENGVLTLRLPKSEAVKPKRINVNRTLEHKSEQQQNVESQHNGG